MTDALADFEHAVFVKTAVGQQEIKARALGLDPMQRRLLILVDGKHPGAELAPLLAGNDLAALLQVLLDKQCIERTAATSAATPTTVAIATAGATAATSAPPQPVNAASTAAPAAPTADPRDPVPASSAGLDADLANLPPADSRSQANVVMARNFMTNTVNTIFQPYTRLTLLEAIANCTTAHDTRRVYALWAQTIAGSAIGAKRLPEFRDKLFRVL